MEVDSENVTALHLYGGPVESFEYLLYQDHFFVDLNHRSIFGDTVAMNQLAFSEQRNSATVARAVEEELLLERQTKSRHISPYPGASQSDKDGCLYVFFRQVCTTKGNPDPRLVEALRSAITYGANPHSATPNHMYYWFHGLGYVPQYPSMPDPVTKSVGLELQRLLRVWLRMLRDAGVDIVAYLKEEKLLTAQGNKGWWSIEGWCLPGSLICTTETLYRADVCGDSLEDCYIAIEWAGEDIETIKIGQITEVTLPKLAIPGGWVEEEEEEYGKEEKEEGCESGEEKEMRSGSRIAPTDILNA